MLWFGPLCDPQTWWMTCHGVDKSQSVSFQFKQSLCILSTAPSVDRMQFPYGLACFRFDVKLTRCPNARVIGIAYLTAQFCFCDSLCTTPVDTARFLLYSYFQTVSKNVHMTALFVNPLQAVRMNAPARFCPVSIANLNRRTPTSSCVFGSMASTD